MDKLVIIIPIYNEEKSIADLIAKWDTGLKPLNIDFRIQILSV